MLAFPDPADGGRLIGGPSFANDPKESPARNPDTGRARELRFVRRVHRLRTLGLGLGFFCVASVLRLRETPLAWWLLLFLHGFFWPHIARLIAVRHREPQRVELRNLMGDSMLGGMWIALMQFNLLPSVLLATMLSMDKISVGGVPLLVRTWVLLVVACALTSATIGFAMDITTPMSVIVASMPLLVVYPLAVSGVSHALASKLARQNLRLDELGRTDMLTGLANRRQCFALTETELARHYRTGRPASLLILDIDRFKDINDRYGHPMGDEVLCAVADVLRACCRESDTAGRYGGDEFLVMLPETDLRGAEEAAARIRRQVDALSFDRAPDLRCRVSVGAAEASREITNVDVWIQQADAALYRAKAAGRHRLQVQSLS
jgi:diguanylate cyclase